MEHGSFTFLVEWEWHDVDRNQVWIKVRREHRQLWNEYICSDSSLTRIEKLINRLWNSGTIDVIGGDNADGGIYRCTVRDNG